MRQSGSDRRLGGPTGARRYVALRIDAAECRLHAWSSSASHRRNDETEAHRPQPDSIPAGNLRLKASALNLPDPNFPNDPSPAPIAPECVGATACSLEVTRPVVVGAAPIPQSSGFLYSYLLNVPGSAPAGTYTGSVTFTASN
jgi:hypothetical protein